MTAYRTWGRENESAAGPTMRCLTPGKEPAQSSNSEGGKPPLLTGLQRVGVILMTDLP